MRYLALCLLLLVACSNPPAEPVAMADAGTLGADAPPADDDLTPDLPDTATLDALSDALGPEDTGPDIEPPADSLQDATLDAYVAPAGPAESPLRRWAPALVDDALIMTHHNKLTTELLGAPAKTLLTVPPGFAPGRPIGIPGGLNCWDVNKNGTLDLGSEDLDHDGQGTLKDCALHPPGIETGQPGVAIVLNSGTECRVEVVTLAGVAASSISFLGRCEEPALMDEVLVIAVAEADGKGRVRVIDTRSGAQLSSAQLGAAPSSPVVSLGNNTFAVGSLGTVRLVTVQTTPNPAIALGDTIALGEDRPTAMMRVDAGRLGVLVWRTGDGPNSLGRRFRQFLWSTDGVEAVPFEIQAPGDVWTVPVTGFASADTVLVMGGAGWLSGWSALTGDLLWSQDAPLGTYTGLAVGGDQTVYAAEISWSGSPLLGPGNTWRVRAVPLTGGDGWVPKEGAEDLPIRWIDSPALLCDLMAVQLVPDAQAATSRRYFAKPCAKGTAGFAWARSGGDNQNTSGIDPGLNCALAAGGAACTNEAACETNVECDDQNACTIDSCVSGLCSHKLLPNCCATDQDCEDFDLCTQDLCIEGWCQYPLSPSCCESSSECGDNNVCTIDLCDQGLCTHTVDGTIFGCCQSNDDCPADPCSIGFCGADGHCLVAAITGCCTYPWDCNDDLMCTADECIDETCVNTPTPTAFGCCAEDADCPGLTPCDTVACVDNECIYTPIDGCCFTDQDCDDELLCTVDQCEDGECTHTADLTLPGCCEVVADCGELDLCILGLECVENMCVEDTVDCDDDDPCTDDSCDQGECFHVPTQDENPACCITDDDCFDGDLCTTDTCDALQGCIHTAIANCCTTAEECDDGLFETTETCVEMTCQVCQEFIFETAQAPVDIVFIVDQSVSMTDKLDQVRAYLNAFAEVVAASGLDLRVVLIATRYNGNNKICIEPPLAGPDCANTEVFKQLEIQVGSHDALNHAMAEFDDYAGFLRPDSRRQFVVITDDESQVPAETFSFFLQTKPGFDGVVFHAILGFDVYTCATGVGTVYQALAAATGGLAIDICDPNWTSSFEALAQSVTSATTSFPLAWIPKPGTLEATLDGAPATFGEAYGYTLDTNRVTLLPPLPAPGAAFSVCYRPVADLTQQASGPFGGQGP